MGHVERRGGFVGDDQTRLAGQRHGNHHPLAHAARKFIGERARATRGIGDANLGKQLHGHGKSDCAKHVLVHHQHLGYLIADTPHRIKRGWRILENHGEVPAAQIGQRTLAHPR